MHPTELLGVVGHVESRFVLFGDSVSFGARQMHDFRQTYHRLIKSFWMHRMALLGDEALMEARFGPFGDGANLDSR
jgi:hypothetical protein